MKLFKAVATITVFTVITRMLGFGFRVYLSRELGAEIMGVYQIAISVFVLLLTLTTSGLPLVVSRKSAVFATAGDQKSQHKTVTSALMLSVGISVVLCGLVAIFHKPVSMLMPRPEAVYILLTLLPAVVFSAVCASMRGQMWGNKKYTSVSLIELIEQIVRIALCVLVFTLKIGDKPIAAGLSLSAACFISAAVCAGMYFRYGGKLLFGRGVTKSLFKESSAVTGMRAASSLIGSLTAFAVPLALALSGLPERESVSMFGAASGMALPIIYLPSAVIGSLAFALVPELVTARAKGDSGTVRRRIQSSVTLSIVVAAIFIPALAGTGIDIGAILYGNSDSGAFMQYSAWIMIPIAIEQITSSVMNSIDLERKGFTNYLIGCVLLFLCIFLLSGPLGIHAYGIGIGLSLTFSSVLDIIDINKKIGFKLSYIKPTLMSAGFALPCSFITMWLNNMLVMKLPSLVSVIISCSAGTLLIIGLLTAFNLLDLSKFIPILKKRGPRNRKLPDLKSRSFLL